MKYKKKARSFVAMLLALVMMVSMLPTTAFADTMTTDDQPGGVVIGDVAGTGDPGTSGTGTTTDTTDITNGGAGSTTTPNGSDGTYNTTPDTTTGNAGGSSTTAGDTAAGSTGTGADSTATGEAGATTGDGSTASSGTTGTGTDTDKDAPATIPDTPTKVQGDGFSDGEPVFVSEFTPLNDPYGIALMATVTGTLTGGNEFSYNSKWESEFSPYTSAMVKYFNGQPAYCIEPHKSTPNGGSMTASDWMGASADLRLALAYGYGGVNDSTLLSYAKNSDYAWLATQEVVWEITGGYSDLSDLFVGPGSTYDSSVAVPIKNAHDYIWQMINQSMTIPSFAVGNPRSTYNDIELSWNGSKWTATVTDTNRVLPNFDDYEFALNGVTTSQSGYTLTINATAEAAKSMLNGIVSYVSYGNVIDPDSVGAWLLQPSSSSLQQCVALNGRPDPVPSYVRAKVTKTTGDLNIVKTSEDGKVSGVTFTVTGPNNYSKTVTTNAQGKISLPDLQPGTYTITETMGSQYEPNASKSVTIAIGDVKTVSFHNALKKGVVQVVKTCEDNLRSGHTFRLTGTSAAGTSVNLTATTNAQGIATFNSVPLGSNYKVEEINTAAKYVVPAAQTGIAVEYKQTTTVNFENKLARGNLKITKTSEDGSIEGMTFRLTGTSTSGTAVNETATTDAAGVAMFTDILVGTNYTVEEINTAERYAVPAVQKNVTISLNNTTPLTFHNALARGTVQVTKTSEDNKVSGIKFRLYGTAINGETVDLSATTNAQGVATFENVLIGNSYTLEEVDTAAKYVVPAAQRNIKVTLNNTTPLTVYNAMKRGDLTVTKTSEDNLVEGVKFRLYGTATSGDAVDMTATTDANGVASFKNVLIGTNYTLEEVDTAVRYVIPEMKTGLAVTYQGDTPVSMENVLKKWRVTVEKTDAETGKTPRGDGVFEGAVYGLYKDGTLVDEYTIGANGTFTTDYYVCGTGYTIKEITAPTGYQIDTNSYSVGTEAKDYTVELNNAPQISSVERINRGTFSITKFISDGTSGPAKFEGNATFQYWLQSAGSYEKAKEDERGTLTTNELGYSGKSISLPYGKYVVHQTAAGDKGAGLAPEFTVLVGAEDGDNQDLAVNNGPITAYLRVVKVDEDDNEVIPWGGAEFEIYNADGTKISQQVTYPTVTYIDKFVTNDEGYFVTPLVLPYGEHYRLVETKAPLGYQIMEEALIFDVTPATIKLDAETGLVTVEVIAGDPAIPPTVKTSAADKEGNKELVVSPTTTIVDTVTCEDVIPNKTYTVVGTLMLKSTGEPLKDGNGDPITATNTFVAKSDFTGSVEVEFTFDSMALCGDSVVVFESLRRGNKEVATHADLTDTNQTVTFKEPKVGTTAANSLGGKAFFPMEQVVLVDTISYEDFPVGQDYIAIGTLMDKATGDPILDKNDEPITAYKVFKPTSSSGTIEVQFVFDATELSGKTLVVFERIYRGTEIVPADSNVPTFASHEDLNDEGQTVTVGQPEIKTKATNNVTGGKVIEPEEKATIKDTVTYTGLIAGEKYTISGKLMNKATGKALLDSDGKEITASTTFTAEESNGSVDIVFTLNATELRGATIVAFEYLSYKDVEIAVHADIDDVDQSVTVSNPSIKTSARNAADGKQEVYAYTKVELVDTVTYDGLVAGSTYTLTGVLMDKATGKAVLGRNNKEITATTTFEAKSSSGTVDVNFVFDASLLGGKTLVVFETLTLNGSTIAVHKDINDAEQTVVIKRIPSYSGPTIATTATFDGKSKKFTPATDDIKIVDTVNYTGLTAGKVYVLVGTLMDKDTGVALKDNNGSLITATTTFTPKTSNGAVNVAFKFDASKMDDKAVVVFETLYEGRVRDNKVIAVHNDIADGAQTVYFSDTVPTGDAGISTWVMLSTFSALAAGAVLVILYRRKKQQTAS